jgi:phosphohistidine phosphatase
MKHLYIMRHGEAEELREGDDDAQRPLTKKGKKAVRAMGQWMEEHGIRPDVIASSPMKRAVRTAGIIRKKIGGPDPVTVPELAGECTASELVAALGPLCSGVDQVLLVGHQPQLGRLVSLLVTGSPYGRFDLTKGSLCHVAIEEFRAGKCGALDLLLSPHFPQ